MSLMLLWVEVVGVSPPLAAVVGIVSFVLFLGFSEIGSCFVSFLCKENKLVAFADWSLCYLISHSNYYLITIQWESEHSLLRGAISGGKYLI